MNTLKIKIHTKKWISLNKINQKSVKNINDIFLRIFLRKMSLSIPTTGREQKTFSIAVALELLIWHSVLLFQHQTQQYKQNLTNLNYVH